MILLNNITYLHQAYLHQAYLDFTPLFCGFNCPRIPIAFILPDIPKPRFPLLVTQSIPFPALKIRFKNVNKTV